MKIQPPRLGVVIVGLHHYRQQEAVLCVGLRLTDPAPQAIAIRSLLDPHGLEQELGCTDSVDPLVELSAEVPAAHELERAPDIRIARHTEAMG